MPSTRLTSASLLAALIAAVLAAYWNALGAAFQFDDYNVIVHNPVVQSWTAWLASMPGIRPLLKLSYLGNWLAGGADPFGFHLLNLLVHLGNTILVFFLCRRFWTQMQTEAGSDAFAWLASLVFALHPAQTEAVTYVSGRSVSLMALFYLGAMFTFVEGREQRRPFQYAVVSPLLFAGAMLVKETAWTLPLALFLWDRTLRQQRLGQVLRALWVHGLVLVLIALVILFHDQYRHLLEVSMATRSPLQNLGAQIHGVFYLIAGPLLALQVNADPVVLQDVPEWTLSKGAVLVGLILAGIWQLRERPWLGVGLLWFFVHLLPTNSFLARLDIANDRQLYLALLGPAVILASLLNGALSQRKVLIASFLLAGLLGWTTWDRNHVYASEIAFWENTAAASPDKARVWNNLGFAYQTAGRTIEAGAAYQRAVTLDPENLRARINLRLLEENER